jgi:glycosyltransferase involved in cell wall biosynthesis
MSKRSKCNRFIIRRIEAFLIRRTDANITVSESIVKELSERYQIVKPTLILNVPDYHPVERSDILRDEIGIYKEHRIILYVGKIAFLRGLEQLAQSLRYLDHCILVIMGHSLINYIDGLKSLIRAEGMTDRVYFFGPVPFEEVTRYAASADVGVIPVQNACLSYYYASPNKVFECVSAGLPVAGSNFPDIKKVIEGHRLGVTFDPESPHDIARAIDYILSDKDRYEEMRRNALEAAKIYNWQSESKKLLALYEGLSDRTND